MSTILFRKSCRAVKTYLAEMDEPDIWTGGQDLDNDGEFTWIGKVSSPVP